MYHFSKLDDTWSYSTEPGSMDLEETSYRHGRYYWLRSEEDRRRWPRLQFSR